MPLTLTPELLIALFNLTYPPIRDAIVAWQRRHNTTEIPTHEQLVADLEAAVTAVLQEGIDWKTTHPKP